MATWFELKGALIGVSNKVGSSSFRGKSLNEFSPRDAREHCLRHDVRSILVIREPIERLESAYNYFKGLGWPRLAGVGYRSIHDFAEDLIEGTAAPDPHWAPQVPQHRVGGEEWWDWYVPFPIVAEAILGRVHENQGGLAPSLRESFSESEKRALLEGPYAIDVTPWLYVIETADQLIELAL